jgi:autotransporter-associated beta strand protein
VKELTGTLILNSANTFAGLVQVNQGALRVAHNQALGTADAGTVVRNGAQVELTRDTAGNPITVTDEQLVLSGTGITDTGALENLSGSNTWAGDVVLALVTSLPAPPPATPPSKATISVVNAADTLTISGVVSEADPAMGLDKIGLGRLTLSNDNSYTGTTSILAGVIRAQAAKALGFDDGAGTGGLTVVSDGAALELFSATGITFAVEEVMLTGQGIAPANLGALRNVSGENTWTGNVVLNSTVSPKTSVANPVIAIGVDAGSELLVSGADLVRDVAAVPATAKAAELHKVGTGTLALGGPNTYAGLTVVEAGVLNIRNDTSLGGLLNDVQTIDIFGLGGTFRLTFNGQTTADLPAAINAADLTTALEGLSTIGAGNVSVTRSGNFIVVEFINALGDADQNQMTGSAAAGTSIVIATVQNGGPSAGTVVQSGATLQLQGGLTVNDEALTLNGAGFASRGALENADIGAGNDNTWSSGVTLGSNAFIGVSRAGDRLTIDEKIGQASANLGVTKVGPGTLEYAGGAGTGNTYSGLTTVNEGTLALAKTGGAVAINGNLTVGNLVGAIDSAVAVLLQPDQILNSATVRVESDGLFDVNGLAETIATLRVIDGDVFTRTSGILTVGALDLTGGRVSVGPAGQLVLNGGVTATSSPLEIATIDGAGLVNLNGATRDFTVTDGPRLVDLRVDSVIGGAAGLNKRGGGLMELERVNTYTGVTTIFAGELRVDGQVGAVDLEGGTLGGDGTVGVVNGGTAATPAVGTVSPGASPGILNVGTSLWGPETRFLVELNDQATPGVGYDQLRVDGAIQLGGALLEGLPAAGVAIGDTFTIITATGGVTGKFQQGDIALIAGKSFTIQYNPNSVVLTRARAAVEVALGLSPNPSTFGQQVTFTATVQSVLGVPTGTVTFFVDGGAVAVVPVDPTTGQAIFSTSSLAAGDRIITARYDGNENFDMAADTRTQVVAQASTVVRLTPSVNPAGANQPITLTAVVTPVAPAAGNPDGTVTFFINGVSRGVAPVVNGVATLQVVLGVRGVYNVVAAYSGSANYQANTASYRQTVVAFSSRLTLSKSVPSPSVFGQPVTFTAVVRGGPFGGPQTQIPTGTVTFIVNGAVRGTAALNANGVARLALILPVGNNTVVARYNGSSQYGSSSSSLPHVVAKANTRVGVTSNFPTAILGQPVTVTATVSALPPGGGVPPGTVTFLVNGVAQGTVPLNGQGRASLSLGALPLGSYQVVAVYNGALSYNGATSPVFVQNVITQPPASRLTAVLTSPAAVGTLFSIRVVARDLFGNPVANFNSPVSFTVLSSPAGGTITGPRTTQFVNGVANFTRLGVNVSGRYVLRFVTAGGLFVDLVINAQGRLV